VLGTKPEGAACHYVYKPLESGDAVRRLLFALDITARRKFSPFMISAYTGDSLGLYITRVVLGVGQHIAV